MQKAGKDYRFTVTIHTDDLAVLYCLRGLAAYCQRTGNMYKTWGGTDKDHWQERRRVTFHFSIKSYRDDFLSEARRLFPPDRKLWSIAPRGLSEDGGKFFGRHD